MAAGLGFKTFTTGEVLTAADTNGYLMQGVLVFASSAARSAAITSPQEGQYSYLKDTNSTEYYDGAAWIAAPIGDITGVTAGKGLTGGGASGDVTVSLATTAKGDLVVGTGTTTAAALTVGNLGETLVADSSTATGLRYQTGYNANAVINGGMDIWQRGTSFTANTGYTADRWYKSGVAGRTYTRQTTSDTTNLPTIQYCLRASRDSGNTATDNIVLSSSLESVDAQKFVGQTVTLSFYARKGANFSPSSSNIIARLYSGTGTDQNVEVSYTGSAAVINQSAVLTTTWQRFQYTATVGTTATELAVWFAAVPTGTAGAADYFEITGVQLELGSIASTFKRAKGGTIQGELAACQRYYEKSYEQATAPGTASQEKGIISAVGGNAINGGMVYGLKYSVTKRSTPTLTFYSYTGASGKLSDGGGTDLAANSAFTNSTYNGTSGTRIYNNSGGTISAAYGGYEVHFTADAEL